MLTPPVRPPEPIGDIIAAKDENALSLKTFMEPRRYDFRIMTQGHYLEQNPIWSVSIRRFRAALIASIFGSSMPHTDDAVGRSAWINISARNSMPSARKKSRCVTGPVNAQAILLAITSTFSKSTWAVKSQVPGVFEYIDELMDFSLQRIAHRGYAVTVI